MLHAQLQINLSVLRLYSFFSVSLRNDVENPARRGQKSSARVGS